MWWRWWHSRLLKVQPNRLEVSGRLEQGPGERVGCLWQWLGPEGKLGQTEKDGLVTNFISRIDRAVCLRWRRGDGWGRSRDQKWHLGFWLEWWPEVMVPLQWLEPGEEKCAGGTGSGGGQGIQFISEDLALQGELGFVFLDSVYCLL